VKERVATAAPGQLPPVDVEEAERLRLGISRDPHRILGAHVVRSSAAGSAGLIGLVVRAHHPEAIRAWVIPERGKPVPMVEQHRTLFAALLPGAALPLRYRLRFEFRGGATWEREDPYRFLPTIGDVDLHLFNEGTHRRLWEALGAHPRTMDGVAGTAFTVWAPNAERASVVGDFCGWDGRLFPMRSMGSSGVFELFVPGVVAGDLYKFELFTRAETIRLKADPFAFEAQLPPATASTVSKRDDFVWGDQAWMLERTVRQHAREPMLIYEVHLGSWMRVPEEGNRWLTYREIAPRLVEHVRRFGFTHVELLPVMEHPFTGSWGYQVTGYYAPTSRFGSPDDFRFFVDYCHRAGIGVILDWVPAHFPKDDWALARFDGTALYEHEDPRLGEHPDWGTLIFNYGRNEVRNFLIANAVYWLEVFHADGLRVDAVASMLYLDYSRQPGQWLRNKYGGRENIDAIGFLRALSEVIRSEQPGAMLIAEESTSWPGVTQPVAAGGLGFTFKWNMGWMHDTLKYFSLDPVYRSHHQNELTFSMLYEHTESFINAITHDEVVHLKRSLLEKMPGDLWQKFANLRVLLAYQYTRPGKALLFMGTELAPYAEWNHESSLDWHLAEDPRREQWAAYMEALGGLYRRLPALWRRDHEPEGFSWIDVSDQANSVLSYVRRDGDDHVVVILNLTPVPRHGYRIGAPEMGRYVQLLSSNDARYGGSDIATGAVAVTEAVPFHGFAQSMSLTLPPLGVLILTPQR
jgi:1,4-alpha-glucan branching enzyme